MGLSARRSRPQHRGVPAVTRPPRAYLMGRVGHARRARATDETTVPEWKEVLPAAGSKAGRARPPRRAGGPGREGRRRVRRHQPTGSEDMNQTPAQSSREMPEQSRLPIDFDRARIITLDVSPPEFVLEVSGVTPHADGRVELRAGTYVRKPEYWAIEVIAHRPEIGLPVQAPYTASLSLTGITGSRGVEVTGATRTQRLDVPPGDGPETGCGWAAHLDRRARRMPT